MKTKSGAKKRFKLTGSGKVKRNSAYANHLMNKKSKNRKKRLLLSEVVHTSDEARIKRMLCKA